MEPNDIRLVEEVMDWWATRILLPPLLLRQAHLFGTFVSCVDCVIEAWNYYDQQVHHKIVYQQCNTKHSSNWNGGFLMALYIYETTMIRDQIMCPDAIFHIMLCSSWMLHWKYGKNVSNQKSWNGRTHDKLGFVNIPNRYDTIPNLACSSSGESFVSAIIFSHATRVIRKRQNV